MGTGLINEWEFFLLFRSYSVPSRGVLAGAAKPVLFRFISWA
jgi:hypothetical protein